MLAELLPLFDEPSAMTRTLLEQWCHVVAELEAHEAWVAEHGTTIVLRDDKGDVRSISEAPKYRQVRACRTDLVKLAGVLGVPELKLKGDVDSRSVVDELKDRRARTGRRSAPNASANA